MTGILKIAAVFAVCTFLGLTITEYSLADMYSWTDKDGNLHVTSNKDDIPEEFKSKALRVESKPIPVVQPQSGGVAPASGNSTAPPSAETYGEKTAYEWKTEFDGKNERLRNLRDELSGKKQYVEVFERGRRFGQIYAEKEIKTYEDAKKGIPEIEKNITTVEDELKTLKRDARYYGVPKEITGD